MKTYLVTGAAGFIGANYIKHILAKHDDVKLVILDALTYAGNLGTIAKDIDDERCIFVMQGMGLAPLVVLATTVYWLTNCLPSSNSTMW